MTNTSKQAHTQWAQFIPLVTVFFFWGFVAASNDILIPVFKDAFHLTQTQSQFVSLSFYVAYTVGSILYLLISMLIKEDVTNKIGYKNSLAVGLCISAFGTLLFYPAANMAKIASNTKSYRDLGYTGFRTLANYIFGGNKEKKFKAKEQTVQI